jgi:23S rRNA A2030 N6-methylase RlmJ
MGRASKIPGGDGGYVKLSYQGMRKLLKSDKVGEMLATRMKKVQAALPGSELEIMQTSSRMRVKVIRGSDFDEANTGDLSRALDLAGGLRGTRKKSKKRKRGA